MEKTNVLISIIIPHHNIPDLLNRCIESIPNRNDFQVIVVDDNSNPEKVDFSNFPGQGRKNVEIYLTKEGKGAGYARNVGLRHAKGKWVLFADSDDFFVDGFSDIISRYFDSHAQMILFKAMSVDSETLKPTNRNENINKRIDNVTKNECTALEASLSVHSPWCRLINRSFIKENDIWFDEVIASNDAMFVTKATCLASHIEVSPNAIYVVTTRQGSLWDTRKKNPKNYLSRLDVQIRRNQYVKKFGYKQNMILAFVYYAKDISILTFFKALWMATSRGALFQGIDSLLKKNTIK